MSDVVFTVASDSSQAQRDFAKLEGSIKNIEKAVSSATSSFSNLTKFASVALAALPLAAIGGYALKAAMSFETLEARLETATGSANAAVSAFTAVQKIATKTPYSVQQLTSAYSDLVNSGSKLLVSQSSVEEGLISIANAAAAVGGGEEQFKSITIGISRMAAEGRVTAERLNQLSDAGVPLTRVADALGISMSQMRIESEKGTFAFDKFYKAFTKVANSKEGFGGAAERQVNTLKGALSNLRDALDIVSDKAVRQSGLSNSLGSFVSDLTNSILKLSDNIGIRIRIILNNFEILKYKASSLFSTMVSYVEPYVQKIQKFIESLDFGKIISIPSLSI